MSRFDLFRAPDGTGYLLDCQADLLSHLNVRFTVPVLPLDIAPMPATTLNPIFEIAGERCSMVTQYAASIEARRLGAAVMSLADHEYEIGRALDCLLGGV